MSGWGGEEGEVVQNDWQENEQPQVAYAAPGGTIDINLNPDDQQSETARYPYSVRKIQELSKGRQLKVFLGERPIVQLLFPVPKNILIAFSSSLRKPLKKLRNDQSAVVVLGHLDQRAAGAVLRWMMSGGQGIPFLRDGKPVSEANELISIAYVVEQFGIEGQLMKKIAHRIEELVLSGRVLSIAQIEDLFSERTPFSLEGLATNLVEGIVINALNGTMQRPLIGAPRNAQFWAKANATLNTRKKQIIAMGKPDRGPLPVPTISFIYAFTEPDDGIRKLVSRGLLPFWKDRPKDMSAHLDYCNRNKAFEQDAYNAETAEQEFQAKREEKEREHQKYLARQARRAARNGDAMPSEAVYSDVPTAGEFEAVDSGWGGDIGGSGGWGETGPTESYGGAGPNTALNEDAWRGVNNDVETAIMDDIVVGVDDKAQKVGSNGSVAPGYEEPASAPGVSIWNIVTTSADEQKSSLDCAKGDNGGAAWGRTADGKREWAEEHDDDNELRDITDRMGNTSMKWNDAGKTGTLLEEGDALPEVEW